MAKVTVRLFAGLREQAGWSTREEDADRVSDVWAKLGLGDEPDGLLYAVNKEYAEKDGGALRRRRRRADPARLRRGVRPHRGSRLARRGRRRGRERGGRRDRDLLGHGPQALARPVVSYLDYEGYEGMAEEMMEKLAASLKERYEVQEIAIHHRVGRVQLGEPSVVIAVSAAHRADALAACKDAIDILKVDVPLWKKEVYEGGEEWIGRGS